MGIILLLFNRWGDYASKMQTITNEIKTPVPAGQKQHGSARWLYPKEYKTTFNVAKVFRFDKKIKYLIQHGRDDLDFLKGGKNE
jgi:type IV secretion system protein VirD4